MNTAVETKTRKVHIFNPVSGGKKGAKKFPASLEGVRGTGDEVLVSEKRGGISELVTEILSSDRDAHVVAYGGDGTVYEAVNGIMNSPEPENAKFSVIPSGSGNDFVSFANDSELFERETPFKLDVVRTQCADDVRYYANVMNFGFDCEVVRATDKIKKGGVFHGSLAYIMGVVAVLFRKKPIKAKIKLGGCVDIASGEEIGNVEFEGEIMLSACANSRYYGGGFKVAPIASLNDGLVDVLIVRNISVPRFAALVGAYRNGTFIDEKGVVGKKYIGVVDYYRCRTYSIEGPGYACFDGEIFETNGQRICAEVIHNATNYVPLG